MNRKSIDIDELGILLGLKPTFHDAEIKKLVADSDNDRVTLDLNVSNIYGEIMSLEIVIEAISEFELSGFRYQNVVFHLRVENETLNRACIKIESSIGLSGKIVGRSIKIYTF